MAKVNKDRLEDQIVDQLDGFEALTQKINYLAEDIDAALLVNKIVYDTNEAIGDMTSLQTDQKDNLVNAVNSTNVKVSSLAQAPNEYEWLSEAGQLEYTLPNNSSYNPNLKWLEVIVGGAPIAPSLIERIPPNKFKLLLSPSDILEGLRVVARWVEPIIAGDGSESGRLHHTSHEIGGNDELDLTKLKGYKENVSDKLGDFNNLDTASKNNLVSAINETVLKTKDNAEAIGENANKIETLSKSANEYEWISSAGQVVYTLPSNTTYDPNTKWLEVKVGGAPVPLSKIRKDSPSQFTLLVDSSKIPAGVTVVARWTETYVPATSGHEATHLAGGTDEIDITKLKGFKESIDDRIGILQTSVNDNATKLAEKATYTDNVNTMIATNFKLKDIVNTLGYYSAFDGGSATYKIVNSGTADGFSIISLNNGLFAQLVTKNNTVNCFQLGMIADAVQYTFTYSGTGTCLDGTSKQFWKSSGNNGVLNTTRFQVALNKGYKLVIPKARFFMDCDSTVVPSRLIKVPDNATIIGDSKFSSILVNAMFVGWCNNVTLKNFSMEGVCVDITPPKPIEQPDAANVNNVVYFNNTEYMDINKDYYIHNRQSQGNVNYSAIGFVPTVTDTTSVSGFIFEDIVIKNYFNGIIVGDRPNTPSNRKAYNMDVNRCHFENIWYHGAGGSQIINIKIRNSYAKNLFCGLIGDFSRGCENGILENNVLEKCSAMTKGETYNQTLDSGNTYTSIPNKNLCIKHNTYRNSPTPSDVHYKGQSVIRITGDGIIDGNTIHMQHYQTKGIFVAPSRIDEKVRVKVINNEIICAHNKHPRVNGTDGLSTYDVFAFSVIPDEVNGFNKGSNIKFSNNTVRFRDPADNGNAKMFLIQNCVDNVIVEHNTLINERTTPQNVNFLNIDYWYNMEIGNILIRGNKVDNVNYFTYMTKAIAGNLIIKNNVVDNCTYFLSTTNNSITANYYAQLDVDSNKVYSALNFLYLINKNQPSVYIRNNQVESTQWFLNTLSSTFGDVHITRNFVNYANGTLSTNSDYRYFITLNQNGSGGLSMNSFIMEGNTLSNRSAKVPSLSARFEAIWLSNLTGTLDTFQMTNNKLICQDDCVKITMVSGGALTINKTIISNNDINFIGVLDGRTVYLLSTTASYLSKGLVSNNRITNGYSGTLTLNLYGVLNQYNNYNIASSGTVNLSNNTATSMLIS